MKRDEFAHTLEQALLRPDVDRRSVEEACAARLIALGQPPETAKKKARMAEGCVGRALAIDDGQLELPRPGVGTYYLGVRLVDRADNTPGPFAVQKIEIPPSKLWLMLLLVPFGL